MTDRFIVVEGMNGTGKTTIVVPKIVQFLMKEMKVDPRDIVTTHGLSGTDAGKGIKDILTDPKNKRLDSRTEVFLANAARSAVLDQVIRPALEVDKWVICDRYILSSFAYAYVECIPQSDVLSSFTSVCNLILPEFMVFVDVSLADFMEFNKSNKKKDKIESRTEPYFKKAIGAFRELAQAQDNMHVGTLTAYKPDKSLQYQLKLVLQEWQEFKNGKIVIRPTNRKSKFIH